MPKDWTKLSDEALLVALGDGERLCLDQLFIRHSSKVLNYAQKRGSSKEAAEDVLQIVFMQLWRKKNLYITEYKALAWIYIITKSELKDYNNRNKKSHSTLELTDSLSQSMAAAPIYNEQHEKSPELQEAIKKLNPREKIVVQKRCLEDMDYKEIAELLQEKESNVRKIYSRALNSLKVIMNGKRKEY